MQNNRQQLIDAANRRIPERIPFTIDCTKETNIMLCNHLGLPEGSDLAEHFKCNRFTSVWQALDGPPKLTGRMKRLDPGKPDIRVDIWGVKREEVEAGDALYWEISESPLAGCETVSDIENYDWPTPDDVEFPEIPDGLDISEWKKDKFVLDMSFLCPFGVPWGMRGMEQFMMDLYINPEIAERIVRKVEEYTLPCLEKMLTKYPGIVDYIGCGDDYGTQNALLLSPDVIRKFFMPSLARHYELGRKYGAGGYHHCCGAIFDVIPAMIDAGVQILNPIQTSAVGMEPAKLKREFGRDLCFHGGIDTQETLVTGTPDEVRAEVRARIETLGPEGYILSPSHVLQADVAPENITALYDEVKNYRID